MTAVEPICVAHMQMSTRSRRSVHGLRPAPPEMRRPPGTERRRDAKHRARRVGGRGPRHAAAKIRRWRLQGALPDGEPPAAREVLVGMQTMRLEPPIAAHNPPHQRHRRIGQEDSAQYRPDLDRHGAVPARGETEDGQGKARNPLPTSPMNIRACGQFHSRKPAVAAAKASMAAVRPLSPP